MERLTHLIVLVFAVFFVWTALLHWTPRDPPAWSRPLIVLALAAAMDTLPPRLLTIVAATGAVGLLYYKWNID